MTTPTDPTPPTAATARDALGYAIHAAICPRLGRPCSGAHALPDADAILAALPDGWTLAAAEAPGRVAALEAALGDLLAWAIRNRQAVDADVLVRVHAVLMPLAAAEAPGRVAALEAVGWQALRGMHLAHHEGCRPGPVEKCADPMYQKMVAILAAPASPAGVSGEVCEGCGAAWKASSHEAPKIACCPDCTHTWPIPAPWTSEPVARCGWRPGYRTDSCGFPEDHEIHHPERGNAGWLVHPFTPATRDE